MSLTLQSTTVTTTTSTLLSSTIFMSSPANKQDTGRVGHDTNMYLLSERCDRKHVFVEWEVGQRNTCLSERWDREKRVCWVRGGTEKYPKDLQYTSVCRNVSTLTKSRIVQRNNERLFSGSRQRTTTERHLRWEKSGIRISFVIKMKDFEIFERLFYFSAAG